MEKPNMGALFENMKRDMIGENAYNIHDDFVKGFGIVCGYTLDDKYYVIGYDDNFGYATLTIFNKDKVYIDDICVKGCKTFKLSKPEETMFY